MKSKMAEEDLQEMIEDGLKPTVDDIIRLNALGLKCELSQCGGDFYALPRVAFLGRLAFREPTIGHGIWIDSVMRSCDGKDVSTRIAVDAFALSRDIESLPDSNDRKKCIDAVDAFVSKELVRFTFRQVVCALVYAKNGASIIANEFPEPPMSSGDDSGMRTPDEDVAMSIYAGVLFETLAFGLGLSVRDVSKLTTSRVQHLQEVALMRNGIDLAKKRHGTRVAEYYATKCEIAARLKSEGAN